MNTCDTCKWWTGDKGSDRDRSRNHRKCSHLMLHAPSTFSNNSAVSPWGIYTGPKFGCIHHEPK